MREHSAECLLGAFMRFRASRIDGSIALIMILLVLRVYGSRGHLSRTPPIFHELPQIGSADLSKEEPIERRC